VVSKLLSLYCFMKCRCQSPVMIPCAPLIAAALFAGQFHYRHNMYVESPFLDSQRFHRIFRKRFRMPYNCFQELTVMLSESPLFERWREGRVDAFNRPTTPLPLLVLCCLRYIGRGWTFDDLSENTDISDEIIRVFLINSSNLVELYYTRSMLLLRHWSMKQQLT
jgi:hypothetical protein